MNSERSGHARLASRLEALLYRGGWPVRAARALGIRPAVRATCHAISINHGTTPIPPLRLAYASDFHAGPTTDPDVLLQACAELRAARPDVLLLGGDFVTHVSQRNRVAGTPARGHPGSVRTVCGARKSRLVV